LLIAKASVLNGFLKRIAKGLIRLDNWTSLETAKNLKNLALKREKLNKELNINLEILMLTFDDFLNERWGEEVPLSNRRAAGVAIIWNNKILLIHPTNSSWKKSTCGIPKGKLEPGEDPLTGALRELEEETGVRLSPDQLDSESHSVDFYNRKNEVDGALIYFICEISDLSEIGLTSDRLPKNQLQLEEVDWGKFVSAEEAYPIINRNQIIILDRHLTLNK